MSQTLTPTLFDPLVHVHLLPSFISIHQKCITSPPYTTCTFLPPLSRNRMTKWWEARIAEVSQGSRVILFLPSDESDVVAAYVMLSTPFSETGPFRGSVEKLLVDPEHSGKGLAKALMKELEKVALEKGKTILMLDTEKGSPAETIYPRLGWTKVGEIPDYGISPKDGTLKGGVFFFKDLKAWEIQESGKDGS